MKMIVMDKYIKIVIYIVGFICGVISEKGNNYLKG